MANIPIIGDPGKIVLPPPPLVPDLPVGAVKAKTRLELRLEINKKRREQGEEELPPVEQDANFQDIEHPLRIEVEHLLDQATGQLDSDAQNTEYMTTIRNYMQTNYPGNKWLCQTVLNDLTSYRHWRHNHDA